MAKVIILKGNKDRGKTSTLKMLRDLLLTESMAKVVDELIFEDGTDFSIVIEQNKKLIGIVSIGDPGYEEQFKAGLNFCISKSCDIIIVASRTQETINEEKTPYGIIWELVDQEEWDAFEMSPYVTYTHHGLMDRAKLNRLCAISLLNTIQSL